MTNNQKLNNKPSHLYRSLIATALLANGIFQFVAPVLAEGTAAGQSISNTATATYEDPNSPGTTINATSNTVVVTVAEVAGITVTAAGTSFKTDTDGQGAVAPGTPDGKVNVGDSLYYTYNVTNVGNDPTKFRIPDQPTVTGPGQLDPSEKVKISYDGGKTWQDVASGGTITNSIAPDASVLVRVPVIVAKGAVSGDTITVKLGNTSPEAQNVLRSEDGGDVYTVDNTGIENGDIAGAPINGVREASVSQQVKVDASIKSYTLATLLKNRTGQTSAGAAGPGGDVVSYELSLRVEDKDPTGNGISPAPLAGSVTITGLTDPQILVSDAIPAGTKLASVKAPVGWQVVYTTTDVPTNANQATWTTAAPADLATVKRVGFIRTGSIAPGTTVSGFQINVEVTGTPSSITIANIAQLFGSSPSGAPVYDESGDQNPSNYDGSNPPGADNNSDGIPDNANDTVNNGYIDPADTNSNGTPDDLEAVGIDQSNNNTGTGAGGEANIFTLNTPADVSLLTGPKDAPDAVFENDNNKDFTNKSSLVPAGTAPGATIDPDGVSFTNTVKNTGIAVANISLLPTPPETATHLPNDTLVTITYGSLSATYKYNGTGFTFQSAQGQVNGSNISATNPIRIDGVQAGATANYGVEVNLPSGTQLSTDIQRGFPAPITAFVDSDNDGVIDETEAKNITIDRVYTGFLRLFKESRVLKGTGPDVLSGQGNFSTANKTPAPGNIIEYRIRYKNISEAQGGTGNIILNARKVVITEDGTAGGNNWALDNDNNGEIDTSNIVGSAQDSDPNTAKVTLFTGNPATVSTADQAGTTVNTDVTKYINTVNTDVTPGDERTFSFQRLVNGKAATGTRSTTNN